MQVQQLMTLGPRPCGPDTNLCEVVRILFEGDFGALPVVDDVGHVVGMLTDRDICIALGTRDRAASAVRADEVMTRVVYSCHVHDELGTALKTMRDHQVRRVPVVDADERLCGIFSVNDAVLAADGAVPVGLLAKTLRAICTHSRPVEHPLVIVV